MIFNFSIRGNTVFDRMNIIFLSDTRNITFKCIFWEKIIFGLIRYLYKKEIPYLANIHKTSFVHFFLGKMIFNFPSKEQDHFFRKKKYHYSWQYKKDHITMHFFLERSYVQNICKKYYFFMYFLRKIIFLFPFKE